MKTVLIVDDDECLITALSRLLADSGYEVVAVGDGSLALALLRGGLRPTMVISDFDMPVLDGAGLYAAVADEFPALEPYFIIMSGGVRAPGFCREHALPFLEKPFTSDTLDSVLAEVEPSV